MINPVAIRTPYRKDFFDSFVASEEIDRKRMSSESRRCGERKSESWCVMGESLNLSRTAFYPRNPRVRTFEG